MSSYVCPACHGPLTALEEAFQCPSCAQAWPVLRGVPAFMSPSALYLARQFVRLSSLRGALLRSQRDALAQAGRGGFRAETWRAQAELHGLNATVVGELRALVEPWVATEHIAAWQEQATLRGEPTLELPWDANVRQLVRDFSGAANCEEEVGAVARAFLAACGEVAGRRVMMAGAKSGRIADEVTRAGASVDAIDLSLVLGLARARLLDGPLALGVVSTANRRTRAATAQRFDLGRARKPEAATRFAVGDPAHAPWPDGTFDLVGSVYFTDVGPPEPFLDEVTRLLKPGGRFVHFGPLGFGMVDPSEHLDGESLVERLRARGFEVEERPSVRTTYVDAPESLEHMVFDNLVLVATRRS